MEANLPIPFPHGFLAGAVERASSSSLTPYVERTSSPFTSLHPSALSSSQPLPRILARTSSSRLLSLQLLSLLLEVFAGFGPPYFLPAGVGMPFSSILVLFRSSLHRTTPFPSSLVFFQLAVLSFSLSSILVSLFIFLSTNSLPYSSYLCATLVRHLSLRTG